MSVRHHGFSRSSLYKVTSEQALRNLLRLLLDSRVVDVPMVYHPTFVMLYSLKSFFFNGLKNESLFSDNVGA